MPVYTFRNENTNEVADFNMSMSEMDTFVKENPNMTREYNKSVGVITGFNKKPDGGFRDMLREIKKSNSRGFSKSNINTF